MLSWLNQWRTTTIIEKPKKQVQHEIYSEKVMISPKSIAIAKSTTVLVSGEGRDIYSLLQSHSFEQQQQQQSSLTTSAASIALSAELNKQQQWDHHHSHSNRSVSSQPSIKSKHSQSSINTSSLCTTPSPPSHPPQHSSITNLLSYSTSSSTSSSSSIIPHSMKPSPKKNANPLSTSVSANGDILYDTHILVPSPDLSLSTNLNNTNTNTNTNNDNDDNDTNIKNNEPSSIDLTRTISSSSPTQFSMTIHSSNTDISMISISKAEKSLTEIMYHHSSLFYSSNTNNTNNEMPIDSDDRQIKRIESQSSHHSDHHHGQQKLKSKKDEFLENNDNELINQNDSSQKKESSLSLDQDNAPSPTILSSSPQQLDEISISTQAKRRSYWGSFWYSSTPSSSTPSISSNQQQQQQTENNNNNNNNNTSHHDESISKKVISSKSSTTSIIEKNQQDLNNNPNQNVNVNKQEGELVSSTKLLLDQPLTVSPTTSPSTSATTKNNTNESTTSIIDNASIKSSAQLSQPVINKKGKNYVLPTFKSQYSAPLSSMITNHHHNEHPSHENNLSELNTKQLSSTAGKLFDRALESINQLFQSTSTNKSSSSLSADSITDPESWKQQMKSRFARFIDDMKSDPIGLAGKKVVVIGVHGWFPMKLVRSMIGEPTGTSTKFCEQMVLAVKSYLEKEHGIQLSDDAITSIPLEGEGKIEDRVNKLYNNLINNTLWLESVSSADVILWATHSQGTPVSAMLMHRLLERGHIHTHRQSVGMLAMAGISHGPFPVLKGSLIVKYFEADAARELFEFMDSESDISQKYRTSLTYMMQRGIKLTLVGSLQDQVVPLYSAIMSAVSHPNILRSIYVDGHIYSENDFIIQLVSFALELKNAGLSDHGLLTHLSEVLAGNLYALEGGHSTIYEEVNVYAMAVQYLFETDPLGKSTLIHQNLSSATSPSTDNNIQLAPFQAKNIKNPYYLTWAMGAICKDEKIINNSIWSEQLDHLRYLFDLWDPTTPKMKSVKLRLQPFTLTLI
ncbi:unnamed protein product [Cunninghamella blakesleeana]